MISAFIIGWFLGYSEGKHRGKRQAMDAIRRGFDSVIGDRRSAM